MIETAERGPLFAFAGGGTGGHLYPALALARALRDRVPGARFLFIATARESDRRILSYAKVECLAQPLRPLSARPSRWIGVLQGLRQAGRLCRDRFSADQPVVVVGTGGLASIPAVRAAIRAGVPTAMLNPDATPGRANRYLAGRVGRILAQWDTTLAAVPRKARAKVVVAGCPVRPGFRNADRNAGIKRFGLDPVCKTLLITGASQGARSINQAVVAILDQIQAFDGWQVLHLTGHADLEAVEYAYRGRRLAHVVLPYSEDMPDALAAADLVVARAGASTLAEITCVGRASILMPYPHHRDQHQWANAGCLSRAGAARVLRDEADAGRNGAALWGMLRDIMQDDAARVSMAAAARQLGRPRAAGDIADHLVKWVAASSDHAWVDRVQAIC